MILSLLLAVSGGFAMSVQSPTNTALSEYIGNFRATCVSFGGGLILLALITLAFGTGDMTMLTQAEWWALLGGIYGASVVLIITFAAPVLGIALLLTIIMFGQIIMSALIDAFGWFGTPTAIVTPLRIAGCIVVAIGILAVYQGRKTTRGGSHSTAARNRNLWCVMAFLGGCGGAIQSPTNLALAKVIGQLESSTFNFLEGFLVIFIITVVIGRKLQPNAAVQGTRWWMYIGGLYGAFGIFANILAMPALGATLLTAAIMLGQLGGGFLIDTFGMLRAEKLPVDRWRTVGIILILLGVILVTFAQSAA